MSVRGGCRPYDTGSKVTYVGKNAVHECVGVARAWALSDVQVMI